MGYYAHLIEIKNSRKTETGKFELKGYDKKSYLVRMSNYIKAEVARKLNKPKNDIDLDTNSGLVTLWIDPRYNQGIKKRFYEVKPYALKREIREDGDIFYMQEDFDLQYAGEKY